MPEAAPDAGPRLWAGLETIYDAAEVLPRVIEVITSVHLQRGTALRQRNRERILRPYAAWWLTEPTEG